MDSRTRWWRSTFLPYFQTSITNLIVINLVKRQWYVLLMNLLPSFIYPWVTKASHESSPLVSVIITVHFVFIAANWNVVNPFPGRLSWSSLTFYHPEDQSLVVSHLAFCRCVQTAVACRPHRALWTLLVDPVFQGFDQPHDLTVSPDGETVFVGETSPDVVWKFIKERQWSVVTSVVTSATTLQPAELQQRHARFYLHCNLCCTWSYCYVLKDDVESNYRHCC